jgi:hypothetical protein
MKREEVYELLGRPLAMKTNRNGEIVESWTRSPGDTTYRRREVVFKGEVAIEKIGQFWFD